MQEEAEVEAQVQAELEELLPMQELPLREQAELEEPNWWVAEAVVDPIPQTVVAEAVVVEAGSAYHFYPHSISEEEEVVVVAQVLPVKPVEMGAVSSLLRQIPSQIPAQYRPTAPRQPLALKTEDVAEPAQEAACS